MFDESFEHPVTAPGTILDRPLSEVFGFNIANGASPDLKNELDLIRASEVKAEEISGRIRLY